MSTVPTTYYVIVCPGGGIVHTIRTPYVSCWPGEGPLAIAKFRTREQAVAAVNMAQFNEATEKVAALFEIVTVTITDPNNELPVLTDLAVQWQRKSFDSTGLKTFTAADWEKAREKQRLEFQTQLAKSNGSIRGTMITEVNCPLTDCNHRSDSATAICSRTGCPLMTEPSPFVYRPILHEPVCAVCGSKPARPDFNGLLCKRCANRMDDQGWA